MVQVFARTLQFKTLDTILFDLAQKHKSISVIGRRWGSASIIYIPFENFALLRKNDFSRGKLVTVLKVITNVFVSNEKCYVKKR